MPSSVQGCTPLYQHHEEGVPSLCLVSLDLWWSVLDTFEETFKDEHLLLQLVQKHNRVEYQEIMMHNYPSTIKCASKCA